MLDEILLSEDGNYRVVAEIDDDPENPRNNENLGDMLCGHPRYGLGDSNSTPVEDLRLVLEMEGPEAAHQWLRDVHGVEVLLPLYLHDHSGLSMTAGANIMAGFTPEALDWDTSLVGCVFVTKDKAEGMAWVDVERAVRAEVADYDLYLRGEVYDLRVQMKVVEHVTVVARYPAGSEEVRQRTDITWVDLEDQPHATAYGDTELGMIGADLLSDCLV